MNAKTIISRSLAAAGLLLLSSLAPLQAAQLEKITREYDVLGRLMAEKFAGGRVVQYEYDANGNLTKKTDTVPNSAGAATTRSTRYTYDELNRRISEVDALQGTTSYQYDVQDNLTSVSAPGGIVTTFAYNGFAEKVRQTSPDTGVTTYEWHVVPGMLTRQVDARNKTTLMSWDALGRPLTRQEGSETVTYTWDQASTGIGRLHSVKRASGTAYSLAETYAYDVSGNIGKVTQNIVAPAYALNDERVMEYNYDSRGLLYRTYYPSRRWTNMSYVESTYDAEAELDWIAFNGSYLVQDITWRPFAGVSGWNWVYHSGTLMPHARTFDLAGRLDKLTHKGLDGKVYLSKDLDWDIGNRISKISDSNAAYTQSYSYDLLDRLSKTTRQTSSDEYTWSANGNRTSTRWNTATTTHSYVAGSNRIASSQNGSSVKNWLHDPAGNVIDDGNYTFSYSDGNRLKSVTHKGSGATTYYFYNAKGQRVVKRAANGAITIFVYDLEGHLIGEYVRNSDTSDQSWQEHIWLGDTPVGNFRNTHAASSPYTSPLRPLLVLSDHLNTPRRLLDTNAGQVTPVWGWEGEAFGASAAVSSVTYNLRFPGQYYDAETGKHYNYFRDYDPAIGRYIESDPIGLKGGLNTYGYVGGGPVSSKDLYGLVTTLITTHDYGFGSHSALHTSSPGQTSTLYDPAGSYNPNPKESRPSGDMFEGPDASLQKYIDYQKSTGSTVTTVELPTTPAQEKDIQKRAEELGGASPGACASFVSSVLGGACGVQPSSFPGNLEENAKKAKCK